MNWSYNHLYTQNRTRYTKEIYKPKLHIKPIINYVQNDGDENIFSYHATDVDLDERLFAEHWGKEQFAVLGYNNTQYRT